MTKQVSYKDAGVDIDEGNRLVDMIKPAVKATANKGVMGSLGGFGGMFDLTKYNYKNPVLVSGTDGVGTKLKLAIDLNKHDTIGIDLVAMCVNDILVQGAKPLFFLDYFACSKLKAENAANVVTGIAEGCKQAGAALIGGETAEMPNMYHGEDYDLAGFVVGIVEKDQILPKPCKAGQTLIGIASSGVHSNGYSLVNKIIADNNIDVTKDDELAKVLLAPTKIYVKAMQSIIDEGLLIAAAHITGGGLLENIPRVLPDNLDANLNKDSWQMPKIYDWIQANANISQSEMHRTFNCGIGMVIVAEADQAETVISHINKTGEKAFKIGSLQAGSGKVNIS